MRPIRIAMPALALLGTLVSMESQVAAGTRVCPSEEDFMPAPLAFDAPIFIDRNRAGANPVSVVADDGSISVSAPAGTEHLYKDPSSAPGAGDFATGYTNQTLNWRSADGGKAWRYVGLAGREQGPHSATSTGFASPDLAIDAGGRIYNTETAGSSSVSVFSSSDDGQSYSRANPVTAGQRSWLTGGDANEIFLYVNAPKQLWRSTNGGLTFSLLAVPPITGKAHPDPLNLASGLIGPVGSSGIAISDDNGGSWDEHPGAGFTGPSTAFFASAAVDRAGTVYLARAGGYGGSLDTTANGQVQFNYFERVGEDWGVPVTIPIPRGDGLWPWLTAGDDGRVALTWYQNLEGEPDEFYIYVAYTTNGRGTMVTCSDGSTAFIPPQFRVANASGRPIHVGKICLAGTNCNLSTDFASGDRRLGEFFTINFDNEGTVFVVSGDTTLPNPSGGPKPVANPIFIKQSSGDSLLLQPDALRPTLPLCVHPAC